MRLAILCLAILLVGCSGNRPAKVPEKGVAGPLRQISAQVQMREVVFDSTHRLWVYTSKGMAKGKNPCIVIAGAGSHLFDGMLLSEGDQPEHIPYVEQGFVVVAYDVSGASADGDRSLKKVYVQDFMAANAGVNDGKRAIDYAVKNIPEVDPNRIAAVGHSSAATLALALAENDSRIKACAAYAPAVDVIGYLSDGNMLSKVESSVPGITDCLQKYSPLTGIERLTCPTMLFHAKDDSTIKEGPIASFAQTLKSQNPRSMFIEVESGGHYDSMIYEGIPAGIAFLKKNL